MLNINVTMSKILFRNTNLAIIVLDKKLVLYQSGKCLSNSSIVVFIVIVISFFRW